LPQILSSADAHPATVGPCLQRGWRFCGVVAGRTETGEDLLGFFVGLSPTPAGYRVAVAL